MDKTTVMISIRPLWCQLIADGKKTVEVRKTKPKLKPPFKCYIYCTKGFEPNRGSYYKSAEFSGSVVGEFVCDAITLINPPFADKADGTFLTAREMYEYAQGKQLYGWHISDLVMYDQPKALDEFVPVCKYRNDDGTCQVEKVECDCVKFDFNPDYSVNLAICLNCVSRPPQSWCYVYGGDAG